jgi:magnesium-transporting ATPase (P-type)
MPAGRLSIPKSKAQNGLELFALVVIPMCIAVLVAMTTVDLASESGLSAMIQFSVRLAVPWLPIALAAWVVRVVAWSKKRALQPAI